MKIEQTIWTAANDFQPAIPGKLGENAQLILLFGSTEIIREQIQFSKLKSIYPNALLVGCSTAGEICGINVLDESLVVTAIAFEHSRVEGATIRLTDVDNSFDAGEQLARSLDFEGLRHVFILSDGLNVNGSDLVKGLLKHLPPSVTATGGLSGDGARFGETYVVSDDESRQKTIAILGFYGERLKIGYGSLGGWDPFGPERLVTKSEGNVLYELDGKSALELYKLYLGDHANGLPATGLLFPLSIRAGNGEPGVVRTILSVDEEHQSMTFAGDVPEGSYARLMKANLNRLIDGAAGAAKTSCKTINPSRPALAILISCVGRKMVLKQRIEEEVEAVKEIMGESTIITGFYSYGEISPFVPNAPCELHNQTMTITTLLEE